MYTGRDGGDRGIGNKTISRPEEEIGEGAAFSLTSCSQSFDGLSACGVNDTTFIYNAAARKGGAVAIATNDATTYVEFHRCFINASTTGLPIKDDPQGEGGAFALGDNTTLVLEDCMVTNNYCGKKVAIVFFPTLSVSVVNTSIHSKRWRIPPVFCGNVEAYPHVRVGGGQEGGRWGLVSSSFGFHFEASDQANKRATSTKQMGYFPRLYLFFERFPPCFLISEHTFKDVLRLGWGTAERY